MVSRWRSMVVVVVLLLGFAVPRWLHGNVAGSLPSPRALIETKLAMA